MIKLVPKGNVMRLKESVSWSYDHEKKNRLFGRTFRKKWLYHDFPEQSNWKLCIFFGDINSISDSFCIASAGGYGIRQAISEKGSPSLYKAPPG